MMLFVSLLSCGLPARAFAVTGEEASEPVLSVQSASIVASGTCGTSQWSLDSDGLLMIGGGTLASCAEAFDWGWNDYRDQIKTVMFTAPVTSGSSLANMFSGCSNLTAVQSASNLNTSAATSLYKMFANCFSLTTIDVSKWDTSKVQNMGRVFYFCSALDGLDVSNWDTSSCTATNLMFAYCGALTSLDVSDWDMSKVEVMNSMFNSCESLASLDVSKWDVSSANNMTFLFSYCKLLTTLDVGKWNTDSAVGTGCMFYGCKSLKELNVANWNMSHVVDLQSMFNDCAALESVDVSKWNVSSVTDMQTMFYGCTSLTSLNLGSWNTSAVTDATAMFYGCSKLVSLDLSSWNTSALTNASSMFSGCSALSSIKVGTGYAMPAFPSATSSTGKWWSEAASTWFTTDEISSDRAGIADTYRNVGQEPAEKPISSCSITLTPDSFTYDGVQKTPAITVKDGSKTLVEGTDYTLAWPPACIDAGTYTVTAQGKGSYTGSETRTITINPKDLSSCTMSLSPSGYTYDGTQKIPTVTVKDGSKTLVEGTDYDVTTTPAGRTNAGTYTYEITGKGDSGKGNYKGALSTSLEISKAAQTITASDLSVAMGATAELEAQASGKGVLSYKSSDTGVVTVSQSGVATAVGTGTATITISAAETENYEAATKTVTVTVTASASLPAQKITASNKTVVVTKTVSLGAKSDGDGRLTCKSSNNAVVKVSAKGVVTGVKPGSAKITITAAKTARYAKATKTVTVKVLAPSITVARVATGKLVIKTGTSYTLGAKTTAGTLSYTSSKPKVVSVSKKGVIKASAAGSSMIVVKAKAGGKTYTKKVKVTVVGAKKYKAVKKIATAASKVTLKVGGTTKVAVKFNPTGASNKNVTYKSSATSVASVSAAGVIKAKKVGTAKIVVTSCGNAKAKATVTVTVKPPINVSATCSEEGITVGETTCVVASVTASGTVDKRVKYVSSDASVLTVDENGTITAIKPGIVTITVSSVAYPEVKATVKMTVKPQVVSPAPTPDAPGIEEAVYDDEATTIDLDHTRISEDGTQARVDPGVLRQPPVPGQVVVISDDNLQGTAIKVENVIQGSDGSYSIQGTQPAFEEVFDELEIERSQGFTEDDIVWLDEDVELVSVEEADALSAQSADEALYPQADGTKTGETFKIKFTRDFWKKKGFGDKLTGKFNGEFQIAFTPLVDWAIDFNGTSLTRLKVMPELNAKVNGGIALSVTGEKPIEIPIISYKLAGTGVTLYFKAGLEGKLTLAYEIDVAAGINWTKGKQGFTDFKGDTVGSHEFSVEGRLGLDFRAEVGLLCFEVGKLDIEVGGKAKGTFTIRNADLWCSDINAWVFAEVSYSVEKAIAKLGGIDAKFTFERWNATTSPLKTPKWHFENGERVDKCTWNGGVDDPDDPTSGDDISSIKPKAALSAYTWEELKSISNAISAAADDAAGLEIAKKYHLVDGNGKLQGDTKSIKLIDGTEALVRILGFRHDDLESGGKAGISFEFANAPTMEHMNSSATNSGGWKSSEMRSWLNDDFYDLLPSDLRPCLKTVVKKTNNKGNVGGNDVSAVTATSDKVWLLSMREVYGKLSANSNGVPSYPEVYDAEGTQYQLYADQGVTIVNHDFCAKPGTAVWWWLRSPATHQSDYFLEVTNRGGWYYQYAHYRERVSPGFCI